ncbi:hypothetical protein, partial [Salmonella sp. s54395]|uniref:hypothetical protein n=1 Tax=Salmonella sp. s54395 TaxID=3159664 RepID=UPI00397EF93A
RSAKYTKETRGRNYDADYDEEDLKDMYDDEDYDEEYDDETFDTRRSQRQISLPAGAMGIPGMGGMASPTEMDTNVPAAAPPPPPPMAPPPPPPPPAPPLPPGGIKYQWRGHDIEATNFNVDLKSKTKCEHKTPDQYTRIS